MSLERGNIIKTEPVETSRENLECVESGRLTLTRKGASTCDAWTNFDSESHFQSSRLPRDERLKEWIHCCMLLIVIELLCVLEARKEWIRTLILCHSRNPFHDVTATKFIWRLVAWGRLKQTRHIMEIFMVLKFHGLPHLTSYYWHTTGLFIVFKLYGLDNLLSAYPSLGFWYPHTWASVLCYLHNWVIMLTIYY